MYVGKRYVKNPRRFLQRLQAPGAADSTKFVLDGLDEGDRKILSGGLNNEQVDHLTSKVETFWRTPAKIS